MSTGISCSDEAVDTFNKLKLRKLDASYVTYKIEGGKVVVDQVGAKDSAYADFVGSLPRDSARFATYDYRFKDSEGKESDKIVFISWVPEDASGFQKMTYAGTKSAMKTALSGLSVDLQATNYDEASEEALRARIGLR